MLDDIQTGMLLHQEGNYIEAQRIYEALLEENPENFEVLNLLGTLALQLGDTQLAKEFVDRSMAVESPDPAFYVSQGNSLKSLNRLEEAVVSYKKALDLKPDCIFLPDTLISARMKICDWTGLDKILARYQADVESFRSAVPPHSIVSLLDAPEFHKKYTILYTKIEHPEDNTLGKIESYPWGKKIRLGYYSPDFRNHAMAQLAVGLFETHDRDKFELFAFSFHSDNNDELGLRTSAAFGSNFIDVRDKSDEEVALLSRELKIDIAVSLGGHTKNSRTGVFAKRCAPVQVNYLGYPGTMGAEYIDYIIADKIIIPESGKRNFTEKMAYLPDTYMPFDDKQKFSTKVITKADQGLPESGFIFCCFNSHYKILPAVFDVWMNILKAVEGSVLWLSVGVPASVKNLKKEAEARGVDSDRLIAASFVTREEHLARHSLADLFLDTAPCNAHTTASDSLCAGLPVLTCKGESFASRVAASLLTAVQLPGLITETFEQYEKLAVDLALDPERMEILKFRLKNNKSSVPLFNTEKYTRHIEEAYLEMQYRQKIGLYPKDIHIT